MFGLSYNMDESTIRRITMNWRNGYGYKDDWIGLFSSDPLEPINEKFRINIRDDKQLEGYSHTSHRIDNVDFKRGILINGCLKSSENIWHIAYISNNIIVSKNCFKTNPYWMSNNLQIIGNKQLHQIVIPGTHDSACYDYYGVKTSIIDVSQFIYAQDESIFDQLVYGIRYFDIRVGIDDEYKDSKLSEYQIFHGIKCCKHSLRDVLEQVKYFLMSAPKEIVIFDFHKFENGFGVNSTDKHQTVFAIVKSLVNPYIIPFSERDQTINNILKSNKRLVIGYSEKSQIENKVDRDMLWDAVHHQWGDKQKKDDLYKWFDQNLCNHSNKYLRSAQAQLTPALLQIGSKIGLRERADQINPNFYQWFYKKWFNCVNIITADYFLGSDVVDLAINLNKNIIRNIKDN